MTLIGSHMSSKEEKKKMHTSRILFSLTVRHYPAFCWHKHVMSLLQIYDDVGTSPIDIAKAFMGARTSALNTASRSVLLKDERVPPYCDGLASSSSIPSTPMRSPICWPGAMIQEVPGYLTPQTQRGRISLHNLPRTPYNRAPYSRSISKVCVVIDITFH